MHEEKEIKESEEPDKDLEEEVKNYFQGYWPGTGTAEQCNTDLHFTPLAILRLARHFAKWQKEQMTKKAVEGKCIDNLDEGVVIDTDYGVLYLNPAEYYFNVGDKVKLIVIKED